MNKKIVICSDGTWGRPEEDLKKDHPTNVLKLARAIAPIGSNAIPQQVFYDWGIGSYHSGLLAGITGQGLSKNIMDAYRYIVDNYTPGDEIYLFGFSRGAYTVRCLSGLINNCGILKREYARKIPIAFNHYRTQSGNYKPREPKSIEFRATYAHPNRDIHFIGVWDTVGSLGIPMSFLGSVEDKDEFYDVEIGSNVKTARQALAIDEKRKDFAPSIWEEKPGIDIKQVWFTGAHSDIGGSYTPDTDGTVLSDNTLSWMTNQAQAAGLTIESYLQNNLKPNPMAALHESRRYYYRLKREFNRPITTSDTLMLHQSVQERWNQDTNYRPKSLVDYLNKYGWPSRLEQ